MKIFWKTLNFIVNMVLGIGVLGIVVMCMSEIIARNIFSTSISWSGEAARYLFVYVVFIGAAALARDREYICMDLLKTKVPDSISYYYNLIMDIILILFAVVLIYSGYELAIENSMQVSAAMGLPKNWVYMVMPVSGALIIIYSVRNVVDDTIRKFKKGEKR